MKRTQLLVVAVFALGLQGIAQAASPFPSDAEASYDKPALSSWAEQHAGGSQSGAQNVFPSDAEASYNLPALESYAERHANQALSERAMRTQAKASFTSVNIDD